MRRKDSPQYIVFRAYFFFSLAKQARPLPVHQTLKFTHRRRFLTPTQRGGGSISAFYCSRCGLCSKDTDKKEISTMPKRKTLLYLRKKAAGLNNFKKLRLIQVTFCHNELHLLQYLKSKCVGKTIL